MDFVPARCVVFTSIARIVGQDCVKALTNSAPNQVPP